MTLDIKKQIKLLWDQYGVPKVQRQELQVAALPFEVKDGKIRILLITSRDTGRWVMPKGWPHKGKSEAQSAAIEAFEEAGIKGIISDVACGSYKYVKVAERKKDNINCVVHVFPLEVNNMEDEFPEKGERKHKWFDVDEAAKAVNEKSLSKLLIAFGKKAQKALAA